MKNWIRNWDADIFRREPRAWGEFICIFGDNATFREWTCFLTGWRRALAKDLGTEAKRDVEIVGKEMTP